MGPLLQRLAIYSSYTLFRLDTAHTCATLPLKLLLLLIGTNSHVMVILKGQRSAHASEAKGVDDAVSENSPIRGPPDDEDESANVPNANPQEPIIPSGPAINFIPIDGNAARVKAKGRRQSCGVDSILFDTSTVLQ
jgi:hypothetical protein